MKHRFEVLDIFRGIFASLVFCFHLTAFSNTPLLNNNFILNGDLFVDFFFVLSGFVISYSYQSMATGNDLNVFFKKRLFRLYPLHFILLLAFVVIELLKQFLQGHIQINNLNNANNNWVSFFSNLFLLNSIKFPTVNDVSWNIPSWSISAEAIAYIVFGAATIWMNRLKLVKFNNYVYLVVIAISAIALYLFTGGFKLAYTFDFGFLRGVLGFFTGAICFNAFVYFRESVQRFPAFLFSVAELFLMALMIVLVSMGETLKECGYIYEFFFLVTIFVFAFEKGIVSTYLKKPKILHQIGAYSYSIYMVHALFISLFNILFIRLLKFQPSAYSYLVFLNYWFIYLAARWTYQHIEMRFSYKKPKPTHQ